MRHPRFRIPAAATLAATLFTLFTAMTPVAAESENWPAFRGADAASVAADDPRLPITWSTTENVVWKTPVDGLGWSSPVVWDDRIFLTRAVSEGEEEEPRMGLYFPYGSPEPMPSGGRFRDPEPGDLMERSAAVHHWLVTAIDFETGAVLWTTEVHAGVPDFDRHLKNTYASATTVTDGERVYAYFGNIGVYALDMEGNLLWESASRRPTRVWDGAPRLRRRCTATRSSSSTTTTTSPSWWRSTRRPEPSAGASTAKRERTGRLRSCGSTSSGPSS